MAFLDVAVTIKGVSSLQKTLKFCWVLIPGPKVMGKRKKKSGLLGIEVAAGEEIGLILEDVELADAIPSAKECTRECKRILWGMVEWVQETADRAQEDAERAALVASLELDSLSDLGDLPLAFGKQRVPARSKSKAKKRPLGANSSRTREYEYQSNDIFQAGDAAAMKEHNVFLARWSADGNFYPARVLGNAPTRGWSMVAFLAWDGDDGDGNNEPLALPREPGSLRPVSKNKKPLMASAEAGDERRRYDAPCPLPATHAKYWDQRYRLFTRFDRGVQLDDEGWFSVTPECIADHISRRCIEISGAGARTGAGAGVRRGGCLDGEVRVILDGFAGYGGNAVSLLRHFPHSLVLSVELLPRRLALLRHNASVYGIDGSARHSPRLEVVAGDVYHVLQGLDPGVVDLAVMSPPWGGMDYLAFAPSEAASVSASASIPETGTSTETETETVTGAASTQPLAPLSHALPFEYDLNTLPSGPLAPLAQLVLAKCQAAAFVLPRNASLGQLSELSQLLGLPVGASYVERIRLHGKVKLVVWYCVRDSAIDVAE